MTERTVNLALTKMACRFKACRGLCTSQAQRRPPAAQREVENTALDAMDTPQACPAGSVQICTKVKLSINFKMLYIHVGI